MKPKTLQQLYTVNSLAKMLNRDRQTIVAAVETVQPAAFRGKYKVYRLADVEASLAKKPDRSLREEKLKEEIRWYRIKNDKAEGVLVSMSDIAGAIRRALGQVSQICEAKLVNEWPTAVAGMDVAQCRIYGKRLHDLLMAECQKLEKELSE